MTAIIHRAEPEVLTLATVAGSDGLIEGWRGLAEDVPGSSYFQTPDWVLGWWAHTGRPDTTVARWHDEAGHLTALVCLSRTRERLHRRVPATVPVVANAGSGVGSADHCGWLVLPGSAAAVRRWLGDQAARRSLLLRSVAAESASPLLPDGARLVRRERCPRVRIPSDPDALPITRSFARRLRNYRRRLAREGVRFAWVAPQDMTAAALDTLFELHHARRQQQGASSAFRLELGGLHHALIRAGGPGRGPVLVRADHGGAPIGMLYGFIWRRTFTYFQTGWDPAWASRSLGTVLVAEAIRLAGDRGLAVFDFLRGAEPYKYRFGARDLVDETWLVPHGIGGQVLRAKYALVERRERREVGEVNPGARDG